VIIVGKARSRWPSAAGTEHRLQCADPRDRIAVPVYGFIGDEPERPPCRIGQLQSYADVVRCECTLLDGHGECLGVVDPEETTQPSRGNDGTLRSLSPICGDRMSSS
jgi:hypothetical protein